MFLATLPWLLEIQWGRISLQAINFKWSYIRLPLKPPLMLIPGMNDDKHQNVTNVN